MYNKDKAITQIIGIKKGGKFLEQNFYPNGQLVALLQFDSLGFKTGNAVYFYENGRKQREGKFQGGIPVGEWTEYAPDGRILQVLR
jgi:antitoxin component YwqK of YwqJK toxin-antitoxin module